MSTSYYGLREHVTSLRLEEGPGHDRLTIWVDHGNAGTLVLPRGFGKNMARMFAETDVDDSECPMRTHWGGEIGAVVTENQTDLQDERVLVSEYGDVLTVAAIRARAGAKRHDKMPTELFGYEPPLADTEEKP